MGTLTNALIVVMCINAVMFLGAFTFQGLSDNSAGFGYDCQATLFGSLDSSGCSNISAVKFNGSVDSSVFPSANPQVDVTSGGIFVDTFNAVKNWLLNTLGLKYLVDLVKAPAVFLSYLGLPDPIVFAIASLWYGITLFLLINWVKGGEA